MIRNNLMMLPYDKLLYNHCNKAFLAETCNQIDTW